MGWSLKLFSIRGIPVRVHFSFLLIVVWAAYLGLSGGLPGSGSSLEALVFAEVFVMLLFVCVALHELAHALAAQLFDVQVQDITLWPLGGLARMSRMPETPFAEFIITGAGPATNILLSLVLALLLAFWLAPQFGQQLLTAPWRLTSMLGGWNLTAMVFLLLINNITLALFNLVPAFPMDGGRLLRSLLATFLPFTVATNLAAWVGQGMAVLMLIVALLQPSLIVMALVAVFILLAAGQERRMVASQHFLRGYSVRQAMQRVGARLHPLQTLAQAAEQMIGSSQSVYLVVDGGKLMGVLSRGDVLAGLRKAGPATRVGQQMTRDILRLSPNESLAGAYDKLLQNNVWLAIVVEDGQVIGTLSQSDLSRLGDLLKAHPGLLAQE